MNIYREYLTAIAEKEKLKRQGFQVNDEYESLLSKDFLLISKGSKFGYNKMYLCYVDHDKEEGHPVFSFKYRSNKRSDNQYKMLRCRKDSMKGQIINLVINEKPADILMLEFVKEV